MPESRWLRLLALFVINAGLVVALAAAGLWATGRFVKIQRSGGDQSQSSAVDFTPLPSTPPLPVLDSTEVRNVILLIGDGMGFSQVAIARSELGRMNQKLFFERFPFTGWQTTHSLESVYTDSASSASSIATGYKVPYQSVSMALDGRPLRTLAEAAHDAGLAVGVVTDSYLWDATPAAFLTHVDSRRRFVEIARQMAASGARVLGGESHPSLIDNGPDAPTDDLSEIFRDHGFTVVESAAELSLLSAASPTPVLALFASGEISDPMVAPSLAELARFALAKVSQESNGYFLLVESEEPDSGGHNRDLQRIVRGIESLDTVARIAVEQALSNRATLVLITADHETGGLDILHGDAENKLGIRWSTTSHSAEPVPIYAFGAGAQHFSGVKDNTEIARVLSQLLDLEMFD